MHRKIKDYHDSAVIYLVNKNSIKKEVVDMTKINPNSLNAADIFAKLDAADGQANGRIDKSVWNAFAEAAGGNQIKNYIEKDNAINAIGRYLANASEEVKENVSSFLDNVKIQGSKSGETDKAQDSAPAAGEQSEGETISVPLRLEDGSTIYFTVDKAKFETAIKKRDDIMEGYDCTWEEVKTCGGERLDTYVRKVTTTDAERKEALNFKGDNGYNYVKALNIINIIKNRYIDLWRSVKTEEDGVSRNSNDGIWRIVCENRNNPHRKQHQEKIWNDEIYPMMRKEDKQLYDKAMADLQQIQAKYPNIETCLQDLCTEYRTA